MTKLAVIFALLVLLLSPLWALMFGTVDTSVADIWRAFYCNLFDQCAQSSMAERIIWQLRMPRVLLAFVAGIGLAISGSVLQSVTRNPLADPYLFGISSGASLGAVLVIAAVGAVSGLSLTLGAFAGAAASVLLVLSLAGRAVQIERMLLAGVATSFMFAAATNIVLYSSDPQAVASWLFWSLGSFTRAEWGGLWWPLLIVCLGLMVFLLYSRQLQTLLAGEESARTLGVEAGQLRFFMLLAASMITATLVAYCGGIGFVGLMVPHIVRRLAHTSLARHLLLTALAGGVFMVWVDVLARTLVHGRELPIGVITAAVGSVFFLLVLRSRRWGND